MHLLSNEFKDMGRIPSVHSYNGGNVQPSLLFYQPPKEAKSLAVICHDPDAHNRGGFTHWVVWNIPPDTTTLSPNNIPEAATEGITDWGTHGWGGPQPPSGTHRYIFIVYALDRLLHLPDTAGRAELLAKIQGHVLDQSTLTGLYDA